jgi:hypothetical protein
MDDRIILVEGDSSNWYEQAIFIVRKNVPKNKIPVDFVAEAEKIVNNYMRLKSNSPAKTYSESVIAGQKISERKASVRKRSRFDTFVNSVLFLGCIALLGLLMYAWVA